MPKPLNLQGRLRKMQANFASDPAQSRGRLHNEKKSSFRDNFQRDRDRVIHCSAFRRLKHKTQVFVEHEGDYYRTRLTHTIEVAQVARTISSVLGLNSELTEAISLAHDLGHPPFGHTGEETLNSLMAEYSGFDHNAHALKLVTLIERHYAAFDGLNLTWETLEGIIKHNGPLLKGVPEYIRNYDTLHKLNLYDFASAEAQVAAISDDIAYNSHDLHDGLRARLFSIEELASLPLLRECFREVDEKYPKIDQYRRQHESLRHFLSMLVDDVLKEAKQTFAKLAPNCSDDLRKAGFKVISFSNELSKNLDVIRSFLFERMYRAPSVMQMRDKVTIIVKDLFTAYSNDTSLLPQKWQNGLACGFSDANFADLVCDYIAGMTDRFAISQHEKLFGKQLNSSGC